LKKILLTILKFSLFLTVGIVLLYLAFKGINFNKFLEYLKNANYWWIVLSIILSWIAFVSRAYRWNLLIEPLGYETNLVKTYHSLMVGYLANYAFPRIGEITRCGTLNQASKIPVDKLIGTVVLERVFDFISLLVIMGFVILAKLDFFGKFISGYLKINIFDKLSNVINFSVYLWIIIGLIVIAFVLMVFIFKERIKKITFVRKIGKLGKGVLEGVKTVFKMKKKKEFFLHTVLIWVMYWLMTYVIVYALPSTSHLGPVDGLFILVIGGLGMSAPVQGGFGAFHFIVAAGLTIYGISHEEGLAFATLLHESQSFFAIFLGGLSFLLLFLSRKKESIKDNAKNNQSLSIK